MLTAIKSMSVLQPRDVKLQPYSHQACQHLGVFMQVAGWKLPATGLPGLTKLKPTLYTCKVAVCNHPVSEADTLTQSIRFPLSGPPKWVKNVLVSSLCSAISAIIVKLRIIPCVCLVFSTQNTISHLKSYSTHKNPILPEFLCLLLLTPLPSDTTRS